MQLKLIRHLWGVTLPWEESFPKIRDEGYVGIESPLPSAADETRFRKLLDQHGLEYMPMGFTGGSTVAEHLQSFRDQLAQAKKFKASQITFHSGADHWTRAQAEEFYRSSISIEQEIGLPVAHETHRGRVFFNPWITRDLLLQFPALKLCCDFSHWVCVAERIEWDDSTGSILKLCAKHCLHIHSRVGYGEGPQVPDPAAPEYQPQVEAHEKWWDVIWESQKQRGLAFSTVTPEFGPPGYLHTLPYTDAPVADLWKVCHYMGDRVAKRFKAKYG
jgi:sugar phosphate isomerase/epimerase